MSLKHAADPERTATIERVGDPLIGKTIGERFVVMELLGRGGMGTVYRAHQNSLHRDVALKLLPPSFAFDPALVARFEREALLCARMRSDGIVAIYDFGKTEEGLMYIAMELVEGETLSDVIRNGLVDEVRALRLVASLCDALYTAHEAGVVHRDIKPSNLMVVATRSGREAIKVLDFGISWSSSLSRLTAPSTILGSAHSIAPESVSSEENTSPQSDLYAVGSVLFEMLTGEPPFGRDSLEVVLQRKLVEAAPALPNTFDPEVRHLCRELLARDPAQRPRDAHDVSARAREVAQRLEGPSTRRAPHSGLPSGAVVAGMALVAITAAALGLGATRRSPAAPRFDAQLRPIHVVQAVPAAPSEPSAPAPVEAAAKQAIEPSNEGPRERSPSKIQNTEAAPRSRSKKPSTPLISNDPFKSNP
jgi:serine/threonine protein kinase